MQSFLARRFTVVVVDRTSGVGRRFTVKLGWSLGAIAFVFSLPVLVGVGIRWSTVSELSALHSNATALEMENASYREATGELATQITSLHGVIDELGAKSNLDEASARAMQKLPAMIKSRAMGGGSAAQPPSFLASALSSPEDTFGMLRDVLGRLEPPAHRAHRRGTPRRLPQRHRHLADGRLAVCRIRPAPIRSQAMWDSTRGWISRLTAASL